MCLSPACLRYACLQADIRFESDMCGYTHTHTHLGALITAEPLLRDTMQKDAPASKSIKDEVQESERGMAAHFADLCEAFSHYTFKESERQMVRTSERESESERERVKNRQTDRQIDTHTHSHTHTHTHSHTHTHTLVQHTLLLLHHSFISPPAAQKSLCPYIDPCRARARNHTTQVICDIKVCGTGGTDQRSSQKTQCVAQTLHWDSVLAADARGGGGACFGAGGGADGVQAFFARHTCSDLCRRLDLQGCRP